MNCNRVGWSSLLLVTILAAAPATAAEKPVNLSLFPPIAIVKPGEGVSAFRFDLIYGKNTSVKVVDLGLVNQTTTMSNGLQWGFVNLTAGQQSGVQLGAINYNEGTTNGFQWAGVNYAANAGGLQLALVNYAETIKGFQVGVVNIIKKGGMFPVMVIANWSK